MTINGYTQPGASPNTKATGNDAALKIRLDGDGADLPLNQSGAGLTISTKAANRVVKGLGITRFRTGIAMFSPGNEIGGNFIGTGPSGSAGVGNSLSGVSINKGSPNNTIGGALPAQRNVISGNGDRGIFVASTGNKVQGNFIGTRPDGTSDLGNGNDGVDLVGSNSINVVVASDNIIGGNTAGAANTIAFNGKKVSGDGVAVFGSKNNRILRNSIHSNGDLGIDLNNNGPTPNDPGDADTGANDLQNKPVIASAENTGGQTSITGNLNSKPNETFVIRFFSSPSGNEGKTFIGQKNVTTNAVGNASFTLTPARAVARGQRITATATDPGGNTSEFSAPKTVA